MPYDDTSPDSSDLEAEDSERDGLGFEPKARVAETFVDRDYCSAADLAYILELPYDDVLQWCADEDIERVGPSYVLTEEDALDLADDFFE